MAKLKTEIKTINIRNILESEINPQQMKESEFKRLVNSIKKDGILTSSVLVQDLENGKYRCISGHHRIKAGIKAGIKAVSCFVLSDLNESTRIRLQLQHNDIHGEPDELLVEELRKSLLEEDLKLVAKGIENIIKEDEQIEYEEPLYSYVHVCLMPESEKEFTQLLNDLSNEETQKYILEKEEYKLLQKCLTMAFKSGYKTPGKSIRRILDVYLQHEKESG